MMKRFHRIISEILLVCMLCAIIEPNAMAVGVNNIQIRLDDVLNDFPVGSYFTTDGQRGSPNDLLSILRAHGLSTRGFDQAQTCVGFAKYVWAKVFGHNITAAYRIKIGYGKSSAKDTWENAKPGDLIYFNSNTSKPDNCEHAAIVWSVSSTGVTILDCNYNNTNQISVYTATFGSNSSWARRYCSVYRANNYDEVGSIVTHIVTFDANGGSVSPSAKTVVQGGTLDALPIPTRSGYTFMCWSTANEGAGSALTEDNYKWLTFDKDTILYAQWKRNCANHTYDADTCTNCGAKLPYDSGFDSSAAGTYQVSENMAYIRTGPYQVKDLVRTASQGEFVQVVGSVINSYGNTWMKTTDGYYVHADKLTPSSETNSASYYVILDDGTVCNRITVTNGKTYGSLPTPTKTGYIFDGWFTSASGGNRITSSTIVNLTGDQTLYAHWTFTQLLPDGVYTLAPLCALGSRLDVAGADWRDNANVQIHESNGTLAQQWEFTYLGDGYYQFVCKSSGKALDVSQAGTEPGTNVQQFEPNGTLAQQWRIENAADGSYFIIPRVNPDLHLDVSGAGNANGTNVQVYTANGTEAQMWDLIPVGNNSNSGYSGSAPQYFNCNVGIFTVKGKTVNLYNNPGDSKRVDYFDLGQSVGSTYGVKMPDGSTWYQVSVNSKGNDITVWLKYESDKMTIRNLG